MSIPYKIKRQFVDQTKFICSECGICEWNGRPLTLEVDHIDGNNRNHQLSNLRYLCPNCHSQTSTWKGKNKTKTLTHVSDDELYQSIISSENLRQALINVGLTPKGGNYKRASRLYNKYIRETNIDKDNSQYDTRWVNDGNTNKKIKSIFLNDYINCGYKLGRLLANKKPPNHKGKIWVNDSVQNKMVYSHLIPPGFTRGKMQTYLIPVSLQPL